MSRIGVATPCHAGYPPSKLMLFQCSSRRTCDATKTGETCRYPGRPSQQRAVTTFSEALVRREHPREELSVMLSHTLKLLSGGIFRAV